MSRRYPTKPPSIDEGDWAEAMNVPEPSAEPEPEPASYYQSEGYDAACEERSYGDPFED